MWRDSFLWVPKRQPDSAFQGDVPGDSEGTELWGGQWGLRQTVRIKLGWVRAVLLFKAPELHSLAPLFCNLNSKCVGICFHVVI